jgi:hypothetical protein
MVYANIEFLSNSGEWCPFTTWAFRSGDLLILAVARLLSSNYRGEWRMRVRH